MSSANAISIVIPTLNEAGNILPLMQRIDSSLRQANIVYEVIFIDDHSTDATVADIQSVIAKYPIVYKAKIGKRGKANSLQEGFSLAQYNIIGMIDADLQYPPEAIASMMELLLDHGSDIVITNRVSHETSKLRKLTSAVFNLVFVKLLFGFDYDTQSGLKIFRKSVLKSINLTPRKWSFDLEFIVRSLEENYRILQFDIPFVERVTGDTKLNVFSSTYEFVTQSLKLRFNSSGKQLRQSYRSNVRFVQQAMNTLLVVGVTAVMASTLLSSAKTSALSLPDLSQTVNQLVPMPVSNTLQDVITPSNPVPVAPQNPVSGSNPITQAPTSSDSGNGSTNTPSPSTTTTTNPQSSSANNQSTSSDSPSAASSKPLPVTTTSRTALAVGNKNPTIVYPAAAATSSASTPLYANRVGATVKQFQVALLAVIAGVAILAVTAVQHKRTKVVA